MLSLFGFTDSANTKGGQNSVVPWNTTGGGPQKRIRETPVRSVYVRCKFTGHAENLQKILQQYRCLHIPGSFS